MGCPISKKSQMSDVKKETQKNWNPRYRDCRTTRDAENIDRFQKNLKTEEKKCKKPAKLQAAVSISQFLCPGITL